MEESTSILAAQCLKSDNHLNLTGLFNMQTMQGCQATAYSSDCSSRNITSPPSLDGMQVHHKVTPNIKFTSTHLCTWVGRGTMRIKYHATQNYYLVAWAQLIQMEGYMAHDLVISSYHELQAIFIIT